MGLLVGTNAEARVTTYFLMRGVLDGVYTTWVRQGNPDSEPPVGVTDMVIASTWTKSRRVWVEVFEIGEVVPEAFNLTYPCWDVTQVVIEVNGHVVQNSQISFSWNRRTFVYTPGEGGYVLESGDTVVARYAQGDPAPPIMED